MQAGQRLVAADGYEVALFPMPYLDMTQDEGGNYSHVGTYNLDFIGWGLNGRILQAPIYAPCTCKLVYKNPDGTAGGHLRVFESINQVHTPGGLRKILFYFGHDSNPPINTIGQVCNQGDLIYHTGTYYDSQGTGDHVHSCMGYGSWVNWNTSITARPPQGRQDLTNRLHYWEAVYVNDTVIRQGYNHNWVTWDAPIPPTPTPVSFNRFPWVLYARKFRRDRQS